MQSNDNKLFAAYKRHRFFTPGILTVLATGLVVAPMAATAQAQTPPAVQNPIPGTVQTPVPGTGQGTPVPGATQTNPIPGTTKTGAQTPSGTPTDANGKPITITPQRRTFDPSQFGGQGGGQFGGQGGGFGRNRDRNGASAFPAAGGPIIFDFRGADIRNVLQFFAAATGTTITADAAVSGYVTIIGPNKPVSVDEAFKILQSVLATRGFTALQTGNVISIEPFTNAAYSTTHVNSDRDINKADPRNEVMTQLIPVENVDAESLAKDLQPLITKGASLVGSSSSNSLILTDTGDNIKRILTIVDQLDKAPTNTELVIYTLKRAEATNVANVINNIYSMTPNIGGSNRGGGGGGGNRGPFGTNPMAQMNIPGMTGASGSGTTKPSVVALADTRTNSVIVTASRDKQVEISKTLISKLDDADTNTLDTHMIKIKYADATMLAATINTVLSNMHGTSSSTTGGNGNRGGGGFNPFQFLGGGGGGGGNNSSSQQGASTDPFAQVVADARTNSLLVTASAEKMATIESYVRQIDVAVPTETTTFVVKLRSASATDVATALSTAFGTTTTTNTNNQNQTRNGQSTSTTGGSSNGTSRTAANRTFGSAP